MNASVENCLLDLCGSDNIDQVSQETLETFTEKYPYFLIGHMLLSKKMQLNQTPSFLVQVQKTAFFFNNPSWLHYQLLNQVPTIPFDPYQPANKEEEINTPVDQANDTQETSSAFDPIETNEVSRVILTDGDDNIAAEEVLENDTTLKESKEPFKKVLTGDDTANEQLLSALLPDETTDAPEAEDTFIEKEEVTKNIPITTEFSIEELDHSEALAHSTLGEPELNQIDRTFNIPGEGTKTNNEIIPITTEFSNEEIKKSDELAHQTLGGDELKNIDPNKIVGQQLGSEDVPITEKFTKEEIDKADQLAHKNLGEAHLDENNIQLSEDEDELKVDPASMPHVSADSFSSAEMLKNIKSILDTPLPPSKPGKEEPLIPIDPYHTVDYFASLGIKLVLDKNPNDKLGRQLKSFTQWLKHMKKLGPEDSLKDIKETEAEAKISNIADTSNKPGEVVTEAMADVLIKQGKTDQAIKVYNKLSFLYPDKSTYFANQIKNLKGI